MSTRTYFIYLIIMAVTTYLIRAVPFAAVKKKIENRFIRSFLYYIPYAVLTAMTIPAIFSATASVISASIGLFVAILLALRGKSLTTVAVAACCAVYLHGIAGERAAAEHGEQGMTACDLIEELRKAAFWSTGSADMP